MIKLMNRNRKNQLTLKRHYKMYKAGKKVIRVFWKSLKTEQNNQDVPIWFKMHLAVQSDISVCIADWGFGMVQPCANFVLN